MEKLALYAYPDCDQFGKETRMAIVLTIGDAWFSATGALHKPKLSR